MGSGRSPATTSSTPSIASWRRRERGRDGVAGMNADWPEISDLVIAYDPDTLERLPATAWGLAASRNAVAAALTVASSASVLLLGRVLDWRYGRAVPG